MPPALHAQVAAVPAAGSPAPIEISARRVPAVIYILRHAEKPMLGDKSPDLTTAGYRRAETLPQLFVARPGAPAPRFATPQFIFATARSKHSDRPLETITPLAQALHLGVNHHFEDHDTTAIAQEILGGAYAGKVVLICWHHGEIPHLAQALGIASPEKWKDDVFNQVWRIDYPHGQPTLTVLPQNIMPGDMTVAQP